MHNFFFDYFYPNEIFLDESICVNIREIGELYFQAWHDFTSAVENKQSGDRDLDSQTKANEELK